MNKTEVIDLFKETLGINGTQARGVAEKIFGAFSEKLKAGEEVTLPGIGKLYIKERPARKGHNPRTGESIQIAASKKLAVKMVKEFRDLIN